MITYFAHVTSETGERRVLCQGSDYPAIAARLEGFRRRYYRRNQVWLAGFVQSFR